MTTPPTPAPKQAQQSYIAKAVTAAGMARSRSANGNPQESSALELFGPPEVLHPMPPMGGLSDTPLTTAPSSPRM
jgi:hypothetical protein